MQKKILILITFLLWGLSDLSAQGNAEKKTNEYGHEIKMNTPNKLDMIDNEIIVKFKERVLSNDFLESKDIKRNVLSVKS